MTTSSQATTTRTKPFRGLLTQLLHEAFYLEKETLAMNEDDHAFIEEDESDQFEVIRQLLGNLSPS